MDKLLIIYKYTKFLLINTAGSIGSGFEVQSLRSMATGRDSAALGHELGPNGARRRLAAGNWLSVTGHRLLASSQQREASGWNPKA
jgi:hypothetical protein